MSTRRPKKRAKQVSERKASPVTLVRTRAIKHHTQLQLFVAAAGRCEFPGCNDFLLEHRLTLTPGNFGQQAHIVAFSGHGPRANKKVAANRINDLSNLMLLCPPCHKLIDDNPREYTVTRLKAAKRSHEERIRHVTGFAEDHKTTVIQFKARIAGRTVEIPYHDIARAVEPRYPADKKGIVIDLTSIADAGSDFINLARREIAQKVASLSSTGLDGVNVQHISVFALGPIPLLVCLGRELSDKVPSEVFQRHRDTGRWEWKATDAPVGFTFNTLKSGTDPTRVALCLSLSGRIHLGTLPATIDDRCTVYELTLDGIEPVPTFLNSRQDLKAFQIAYQSALRNIGGSHPGVTEIHLFPAVPAPVAVLCGREVLPKVDPKLLVYDANKATGGFTLAVEVN